MKGDFSMTKMKKICIPVLAAAALAFSVPGTTQEAEASCNTYRVNVATGYLALRTDTSYNSGNEIGELYSGDLVEVMDYTCLLYTSGRYLRIQDHPGCTRSSGYFRIHTLSSAAPPAEG